MGDESWFYHYESETKWEIMDQHYLNSLTKKKAKTMQPVEKVISTIFWNADGCVLVEFLEPGETINATVMPRRFTSSFMQCEIKYKRPGKRPFCNMIMHNSVCLATEKIQKIGWEDLPHPTHSSTWHPLTTLF